MSSTVYRKFGTEIALIILSFLAVSCSQKYGESSSLSDVYDYRVDDIKSLREGFKNPPQKAGPWVYWFWFDNVVNREEITRELEEIASAGIAGVELRCVTMHGFKGRSPGPGFYPESWAKLNHRKYDYFSPEYISIL